MVFWLMPFSHSLASFIDSVLELIGLNSRSNWLNLLGLLPKVNSPRRRRIHLSPIMATVCSTSSGLFSALRIFGHTILHQRLLTLLDVSLFLNTLLSKLTLKIFFGG